MLEDDYAASSPLLSPAPDPLAACKAFFNRPTIISLVEGSPSAGNNSCDAKVADHPIADFRSNLITDCPNQFPPPYAPTMTHRVAMPALAFGHHLQDGPNRPQETIPQQPSPSPSSMKMMDAWYTSLPTSTLLPMGRMGTRGYLPAVDKSAGTIA